MSGQILFSYPPWKSHCRLIWWPPPNRHSFPTVMEGWYTADVIRRRVCDDNKIKGKLTSFVDFWLVFFAVMVVVNHCNSFGVVDREPYKPKYTRSPEKDQQISWRAFRLLQICMCQFPSGHRFLSSARWRRRPVWRSGICCWLRSAIYTSSSPVPPGTFNLFRLEKVYCSPGVPRAWSPPSRSWGSLGFNDSRAGWT